MKKFKSLGKKGSVYHGLETFGCPPHCSYVKCISDEMTALCPITAAPDWYTVAIEYFPKSKCVESKSLKLYLGTYRNEGMFVEALSDKIATDLAKVLECSVTVKIVQKARGGVSIEATSDVLENQ